MFLYLIYQSIPQPDLDRQSEQAVVVKLSS